MTQPGKTFFSLLIFLLIIPPVSGAGVPIVFKGALTDQLFRPIDVAIGPDGTVAVAEIHRKKICLYGQDKKLISVLPLAEQPLCVAFSAGGDLYVGVRNDVIFMDRSGEVTDRLSRHGIAFQSVSDIAAGGNGKIYVLDREANKVTIVGPGGEMESSFGEPGTGPGQFRQPSGIAVSPAGGELIVADAGNSRVQIFSEDGRFGKMFGEHIKQTEGVWQLLGTFARMSGVSADGQGRIYVSDSGLDHIQIFDISGNHAGFLGRVGERAGRFRVPSGMAVSGDGRMFVASTAGSEVKEYAIETTTDAGEPGKNAPKKFFLSQNYPNPFNPSTKISFSLPEEGFVTLKIYDILGAEVAALAGREYRAGSHAIGWDGKDHSGADVSAGIYFYCLQVGEKFSQTNKMIFLK